MHNIHLPTQSLTVFTVTSPFSYSNIFSNDVDISPTGPLGLNLEDDKTFGLPLINSMQYDSPFTIGCKKNLQKNVWIVGVHHDEPVTVARLTEYVE